MSIDWKYLRTIDGSQQTAFEELCRQLAYYENVPKESKFFRIGAPDAGVECYWKMPNEEEIGWQAKFFTSPPNENQWKQIDKSIRTALEKHPNLTQYYVCLPLDRQDPRIPEKEWFMDKWNARVNKWQEWAKEKGISITFDYWGESDIWDRLSRSEHRGRHHFWFNKELFDQRWFERQIRPNIQNAGERYSPEINFELPIAKIFDGLGRTESFFKRLESHYFEIKSDLNNAVSQSTKKLAESESESLIQCVNQIKFLLLNKRQDFSEDLDFEELSKLCSRSYSIAEEIFEILEKQEEADRKKFDKRKKKKNELETSTDSNEKNKYSYEKHFLWELKYKIRRLREYIQQDECKLANLSALLLVGEAGTGKTHLFCDIAEQRLKNNLPTILLHGINFQNEEPLLQLPKRVGLSLTSDKFLGALEATAQASKTKALILIDALNETDNRSIWENNLVGLLWTLSNYKWISLAISVRSSYEEVTIPKGIVPQKIIRVEHHGFGDKLFEAADFFFKEYKIKAPSIPILNPEFQNPLFLKTFCKAIVNFGLTEIPKGLSGLTQILNFFNKSINEKLSKKLGLDADENIVIKALEKIAEAMNENSRGYLFKDEAKKIINQFHSATRFENSLFYHLLAEGAITKEIHIDWENDKQEQEIIRFTYEKFTDNSRAKQLLDKFLNDENPTASFSTDTPLGQIVKDHSSAWRNKGIIEAFSIQLPERIGKELFELAPHGANWYPIKKSFLESLIWRNPKAITEQTKNYVNKYIIIEEEFRPDFWDAILTVSTNPEHVWNADFLDKYLKRFKMAERDFSWSIFLHEHYSGREYTAIHRIIDWAWSGSDKAHIEKESIRLCGITLSWFLTSSNRFLRDRATKALVSLFSKPIKNADSGIMVLKSLIEQFLDVNDLYILERLFAVAYGCSMRSSDNAAITELTQSIYDGIFKDDKPIPHILLRDYARGVIEVASHRNLPINIDSNKITPPYKSEFPKRIPSRKTIEKKYLKTQGDRTDKDFAREKIYHSVMTFEDFARYIVGTNFGSSTWVNKRLMDTPTTKKIYEDFVESLNENEKKLFDTYQEIRQNLVILRRIKEAASTMKKFEDTESVIVPLPESIQSSKETDTVEDLENLSEKNLIELLHICENELKNTLDGEKLDIFVKRVIPYLKNPMKYEKEDRLDLSIIQRWIAKRVLDLGWKEDFFGYFDRNINRWSRNYRESHKPERIGKKYQWIAYHEIMAYVADNYRYEGADWEGKDRKYVGTWQRSFRDIDPSCLLSKTKANNWNEGQNSWWFPLKYDITEYEKDLDEWIRSSTDLPEPKLAIEVINPKDNSVWFNLETFFEWSSKEEEEKPAWISNRKGLWYILKSYFVKKEHLYEVFDWAKKQNFWGKWMPEVHALHDVYLGEFYWSSAYKYFENPYYGKEEWTKDSGGKLPYKVMLTTEEYSCSGQDYDCSIEEGYSINLPAKIIVEKLGLNWNGNEGYFFDKLNKLVAFDPTIKESGTSTFLIKKETLVQFLAENNLGIFWTLVGEKSSYQMSWDDWLGSLKISGAYTLIDNRVEGSFSTAFEENIRKKDS